MKTLFFCLFAFLLQSNIKGQTHNTRLIVTLQGFKKSSRPTLLINKREVRTIKSGETLFDQSFYVEKLALGMIVSPNGTFSEFWIEPGLITVKAEEKAFPKILEVSGSETDQIYRQLKSTTDQKELQRLLEFYRQSYVTLNYLEELYVRVDYDFLKKFYDEYPPATQKRMPKLAIYLRTAQIDEMKVGSQLWDFEAKDEHGKTHSTMDSRGKFLLIDFAATWCGPCWNGYSDLIKIKKKYPELNVITFNQDLEIERWNKIAKSKFLYIDWPVLWTSETKLETSYVFNITNLPSFFLVSPEGIIIDKWIGSSKSRLKQSLQKHLLHEE